MQRIRNRCAEAILNLGVIGLVVAGMALISDDVRRHLGELVAGDRAGELALVIGPADHLRHLAMDSISGYQSTHGPVVAFAVGAFVLVCFMLKT